jgi:small subunit ribosomal protein S20
VARHKSAMKRNRQNIATRGRNRTNLSQLKTQVKKLRSAIEAGDAETASRLLPETVAGIDKAARKGVVHDNAADRHKSRLTRKVNALAAAKA